MHDTTRRRFLAMTGAGTAAGAAAVALPSSASAATTDLPSDAAGSMAVYVHDVRTGEAVVMVDGHEVTVTDRELIARIAHAYARSDSAGKD
jgi:hypothetical protein